MKLNKNIELTIDKMFIRLCF